jgi:ATP-dependent protease ClpP protease subunit
MELKHVKNMTSDTASMFIFSEIGAWGIDGQQFANEIEWLGRNGITTINVHINSGGGSVIDGLSILRSMQLFDGIINTHVEGVAASIAGVLAMGGKTRSIVDFGRIMIHDPSFSGNEALDEKQQKAVDAVRQMLIVIFDKNTTMTTDEISSIMTAETWFDAAESLSRGLVDKVIDTERKFENIFKGETNVAAMVNRATTIYNKPNTEIQKRKMINLTSHLKLAENAAETAIIDAVKVIEENAAIVDGKLNDANATIAANATEITSLKKVVATADVDKAITAGQIKKESRAAMIELAIENQKAFNAIVENVPVKAAKIMDLLNDGKPDADLSILINGKSFRELEKTDNALLNRIEKEDVKMFNKMYFNQYGVKHPNDVEK